MAEAWGGAVFDGDMETGEGSKGAKRFRSNATSSRTEGKVEAGGKAKTEEKEHIKEMSNK